MKKHENGDVTLTKREFAELNKAYQGLYDLLCEMPTSLGDLFQDDQEKLIAIFRWHEQLQGNNFVKSYYFDEERN